MAANGPPCAPGTTGPRGWASPPLPRRGTISHPLTLTTDGTTMRWLLIGYMFLFIDRPFEVWPWLGDLRFERVYMLVTLAVWAVYPYKRWLPNVQHAAYAGFAAAVAAAWLM